MVMAYIWTGMAAAAVLFGALTGGSGAVSAALMDGAGAAVELMLSIGGAVCLWSGVMEVMSRSGLTEALSRVTSPLLRRLFPGGFADKDCAGALSENFAANLLGLGNAATPMGIAAARRMQALSGSQTASDELCRLVVLNTASVQLLPATVAALRAGLGAPKPMEILPAVWLSSLLSVSVGLAAAALFGRGGRR